MGEKYHFEDLHIDGKMVLKWVFKEYDGRAWTGLFWLMTGTSSRLL